VKEYEVSICFNSAVRSAYSINLVQKRLSSRSKAVIKIEHTLASPDEIPPHCNDSCFCRTSLIWISTIYLSLSASDHTYYSIDSISGAVSVFISTLVFARLCFLSFHTNDLWLAKFLLISRVPYTIPFYIYFLMAPSTSAASILTTRLGLYDSNSDSGIVDSHFHQHGFDFSPLLEIEKVTRTHSPC
jgi:hypothetical protein